MTSTWLLTVHLCGVRFTLHVPKLDDVKLLTLCLAWLPGVFVSDVTYKTGEPPVSYLHHVVDLFVLQLVVRPLPWAKLMSAGAQGLYKHLHTGSVLSC